MALEHIHQTKDLKDFVNTSLVDLVTKKIKNNIYSGKYKPGQRLIVREISEELGVSHTPIKDALNRLVVEGYVESLPRRSMVVKEFANDTFVENLEIRLMCEIFAAPYVIETAQQNPGFISQLQEYINGMDACIGKEGQIDYETWIEMEAKFHRSYVDVCKNQRFISIYRRLDSNIHSFFAFVGTHNSPLPMERFYKDQQDHKAILKSVQSLDTKQLLTAIASHIIRLYDDYAVEPSARERLETLKLSMTAMGIF